MEDGNASLFNALLHDTADCSAPDAERTFYELIREDAVEAATKGELRLRYSSATGLLHIQLNRPRSMNATSLTQLSYLAQLLPLLAAIPRTMCTGVVFTGTGGKAFCAGADLKQLISNLPESGVRLAGYHYSLSYFISTFTIPVISFWEGLVIGGGVGLSLYGRYRIATDTTQFSMPETGIGFFPDVGASYFYGALPGSLGVYLGLTGNSLNATDLVDLGLATHFVPQALLPALLETLLAPLSSSGDVIAFDLKARPDSIDTLLRSFNKTPNMAPLLSEPIRAKVAEYFDDAASLSDILSRLQQGTARGDRFAEETYETLRRRCPLSCGLWFRRVTGAKGNKTASLYSALDADFHLAVSLITRDPHQNLVEGVEALLVRKDRKPCWNPCSFDDVGPELTNFHLNWRGSTYLGGVLQLIHNRFDVLQDHTLKSSV